MNIISLGLGVQSTALYFKSSLGEIERADYAIFADTGAEKTDTYIYLEFLKNWAKRNNGIPILHQTEKNLYRDLVDKKFSYIPAFTKVDGKSAILKRQCTSEYKIKVVDNTIRELHNLKPYQRLPKIKVQIGISLDEMQRIVKPREVWKTLVYPFLAYEVNRDNFIRTQYPILSRNQLIKYFQDKKFPVPTKSACVFCPFQSDMEWKNLKKSYVDFNFAVLVDNALRTNPKFTGELFLHESLKPLKEIDFTDNQLSLFGECGVYCEI